MRKPGTGGSACREGEASGIYGVGSACIQPRVNQFENCRVRVE